MLKYSMASKLIWHSNNIHWSYETRKIIASNRNIDTITLYRMSQYSQKKFYTSEKSMKNAFESWTSILLYYHNIAAINNC